MLIALEGLDAAGKATQSKLLAERIIAAGGKAVVYSFPRYDTPLGTVIKRHLMSTISVRQRVVNTAAMAKYVLAPEDALVFQTMMVADKNEAAPDIEAHMQNGYVVICDRWTASAMAFGVADGLDRDWLERVQRLLPKADLQLFLDITEEEALRRRPVLRDRYEMDRDKQKVVAANYRLLWMREPVGRTRWLTVNGMGYIEQVSDRLWGIYLESRRPVAL